jgi:hypothetical protein
MPAGLILKILPYFGLILVIVGVYAASQRLVNEWHDSVFQQGVQKEQEHENQIAQKITDTLGQRMNEIDQNTKNLQNKQSSVEIKYVGDINKKIKSNPVYSSCAVEPSVLSDRNQLRKSLENALPPTTGTNAQPAPVTPAPNN